MKKSLFTPFIITLLMLVSCKDAKPQSGRYFANEEDEARYLQGQEDRKQFYLATIKLCQNEDYKATFGTYREQDEYIKNNNCCLAVVPKPYISPMEYYNYMFEGNKEIYDNQKNPFNLSEIRKQQAKKNKAIKEKALKIDTDNLTAHLYKGWEVRRYDFDQQKLEIRGSVDRLINTTSVLGPSIEIKSLPSRTILIDMSNKDAEKLFKYFEDNKGSRTQALPANIYTKIIYSLKKPKERWKSTFMVKIKKLEFFKTDEWNNEIGQITF